MVKVMGIQESKNFCASYRPKLFMDFMKFAVGFFFCFFLRIANLINLDFISSIPIDIQGRESNLCDFVKRTVTMP